MKISQYYSVNDATASYVAEKNEINNSKLSMENYDRVIDIANETLDPIHEKYGRIFKISSWYRCPELNEKVGGVKNSEHTLGSAVDLVPIDMTAYKLALLIKDSDAVYNKLIIEYRNKKEWVHVQYREDCEHLYDDYTYFGKNCYIGLHTTEPKEAA